MSEKELLSNVIEDNTLSIRGQCELLEINRSSLYYNPIGESEVNLQIMRLIDEHCLNFPTHGVLQVEDFLRGKGFLVNHKRVRRLMRKMGIEAIYPKLKLSKLGNIQYIRPYLLRRLKIGLPNQVWAIDITYIPMASGFMYLIAIIDVYSRFIVGWDVFNSLEAENTLIVLKHSIERYGKPEIINSDQGSQFTSALWVEYLEKAGIKISMDGKGRAIDNIYIERFWRTIKQDYVYLNPANDGHELYLGIKDFVIYYNTKKSHQGIGRTIPIKRYQQVA